MTDNDTVLRSHTVQLDEHRMHMTIAGDSGPLVLLIHGWPESAHSWRHQLRALAEAGYRAVAIDQLGYGRSSAPVHRDDGRITNRVALCAWIIEALGESRAIVVGHDWGAAVAWTCAWTRPDVFDGVVGLSVPFGGRGLMALPGSPRGELRPSEIERRIAGPGRVWYQQHITNSPDVVERDLERDVRRFLTSAFYTVSASFLEPVPPLRTFDEIVDYLRGTGLCVEPGVDWSSYYVMPEVLPDWLTEEDIDVFTAQYEQTGFAGPLSSYRTNDLDWELLAAYDGRKLEVPALYIGGDRDVCTIWGREAIESFADVAPASLGTIVLDECGHWVQQERPDEVNAALLDFLRKVRSV
ncbi:alpha/beta hydrolase [Pseudonocardia sp. NPDC049154]|uniref:alpha/beta fold hydrolase n=1 Tax=Pseudonocardia sp. NPDC049154 TaxID=3155501 RepID=UPI0033D34EB2